MSSPASEGSADEKNGLIFLDQILDDGNSILNPVAKKDPTQKIRIDCYSSWNFRIKVKIVDNSLNMVPT